MNTRFRATALWMVVGCVAGLTAPADATEAEGYRPQHRPLRSVEMPSLPGGRLPPEKDLPLLSDAVPNLDINSLQIVDRTGAAIAPQVGIPFWVRVNFRYDNPVCTLYAIRRTVNGFTHDAPLIDAGCGLEGSSFWWHYWGPWVMHDGGTYAITVTLDANNAIAESNELDNTETVNFNFLGTVTPEWALVKADQGRTLLGDGTDVIVGTMDDAFDYLHPWLTGTDSLGRPRLVAANQNNFGTAGSPLNAVHATAVMGIVLSKGVNPGDIMGLAPDARYVTAEFINRADIPGHPVLDVLDAAGFLVQNGAEVINMSWSWWFGSTTASEQGETSVTNLMADYLSYGLNIVCVPAVNQLSTHIRPTAPGSSRNVITVGGLHDDLVRAWSEQDHGPTLDGRSKPDLIGNDSENAIGLWFGWRFGFPATGFLQGTSFAAPFVTGAVAQMLDYGKHNGENTDHRVIKAIIMNSGQKAADADGSPWSNSPTVPLDDEQGTGILDLARVHAMYAAGQQTPGPVDVPGYDFRTVTGTAARGHEGGTVLYRLGTPVVSNADMDVTVVWDRHTFWNDANGNSQIDQGDSFFTSPTDTQDDLDLVVLRDGVEWAASRSSVDNIEHLHITGATLGVYDLRVERLAVPFSGSGEDYAMAWDSSVRWVYPDRDGDGDVDLGEFAVLQQCFGDNSALCLDAFDFDESGGVDLTDYTVFQATLQGPQSLLP